MVLKSSGGEVQLSTHRDSAHESAHHDSWSCESREEDQTHGDLTQLTHNRIADDYSALASIVRNMSKNSDNRRKPNVHLPSMPMPIADRTCAEDNKKHIMFECAEHLVYYAFNHEADGG